MCAGINLFDWFAFCSVSVSVGVSALDRAFIVILLLLLWCCTEVSWRLNLPSFLPPLQISFLFTRLLVKEETEKKEAQHNDDDNDDDIIIKQSAVIKYAFVWSIYCAQK